MQNPSSIDPCLPNFRTAIAWAWAATPSPRLKRLNYRIQPDYCLTYTFTIMAIPAAELKIGQSVRYLIGTRSGMSAAITDISKSSLSIKNTHIVTLTFDDDSLPNHLKTQQLTVYDELLEGCEIITF
ncbi:hypothetical protein ACWATR_40175 [Nostoc sp. UIC 10890]